MKISMSKIMFISAFIFMLPMQFNYADETVYGWQLMTEQERAEHRAKMQSMKTKEERERYRMEHHQKMQARAKQRGVTLPDEPQQRGKGMGNGMGSGAGSGQGGGRGR